MAPRFKTYRRVVGIVLASVVSLGLLVTVARQALAHLTTERVETYVEIDGVDFGTFGHISGLKDITSEKRHPNESFTRILLARDFVADPSLSKWASTTFNNRSGLKDIWLVMRKDGHEVSRYALKLCKPLSWTVEAADQALGGFHEKVEFAVHKIAVY